MKKLTCLLLFIWLFTGCRKETTLISDPARLNDIENMLKIQKELTINSLYPIWPILDKTTSSDEKQALQFLYAYMPLSDLADYGPDFMLSNVRQSLLARKEMAWGNRIPEEEFLHFVLPLRVNNENLDSFRLFYYKEIKDRIKGLSMKEAALEINHWCHEKVNYRGTDSRTSSPMSTISKTFGRCGEESTFTVSAMRTAGIPARQVYTPRWAHTDDNHAWVEVWIDGSWHYLGACEPDTDLDRGWFSEPSQRTMLVHTRTYGRYFGPEEVVNAEERFSELNLTANYAKTKRVTILVSNSDGTPAEKSKVEFKLYNYAELYPIATIFTDGKGAASLTTGMGDLVIWASKNGMYGFNKLSVPSTDTLRLTLGKSTPETQPFLYDLVPPAVFKAVASPDERAKKINDQRLAHEDSLRNSYMATFKDSAWIRDYAKSLNVAEDTMMHVIRLSYGNWKEITAFIEKNLKTSRNLIFPLLYGISAKDLSDTREYVLADHLVQNQPDDKFDRSTSNLFEKYVLSPRVDLELLMPWRGFLAGNFGPELAAASRKDISALTGWILTNIRIDPVANKHSRAPITPVGVYNLRVADPLSRDIFFVAACRAFGIPARLNPETHTPEYNRNGSWYRAGFEAAATQPELGPLYLKDQNNSLTPQYSLHFTIARIENGSCKTLEFEEGLKMTDFQKPVMLEIGRYLLVTGKRLSNAAILNSLTFFSISKDKPTTLAVELRNEESALKPFGRIVPAEINLKDPTIKKEVKLSDLMQQSGSVIVLLDPGSEPSKHILNDLAPYLEQFNNWEGKFIFVSTAEKEAAGTVFHNYKLPVKSQFLVDSGHELEKAMTKLAEAEAKNSLPVVLFSQPDGKILLFSAGYKIGTGEQLMQVIKKIAAGKSLKSTTSCTTP